MCVYTCVFVCMLVCEEGCIAPPSDMTGLFTGGITYFCIIPKNYIHLDIKVGNMGFYGAFNYFGLERRVSRIHYAHGQCVGDMS